MAGLDLPVIPPSEQTRATARRLQDIGPLLWGDLTSCAQDHRSWISEAVFYRLRLFPTPRCHAHKVPISTAVEGNSGSRPGFPGGIYELLNFPTHADETQSIIYYRRWIGVTSFRTSRKDRVFPTPGHRFKSLHPLTGGGVPWFHYFTVQQFTACAPARLLTSVGPRDSRILLHTICEPPVYLSADPPSSELVETLRPCLAHSTEWDVYVDGSWYPLPGSAGSHLGEAWTHTGGCSLIFAAIADPLSSGVVILRMDAGTRFSVHGGGAGKWNCCRPLRAQYFYTVWANAVGSSQTTKALWSKHCMSVLQDGQITLHWHRGHPKRREKDRAAWSRDDLGSYLANLYAPPRADPSPSNSPTWIKQVILTDLAAFHHTGNSAITKTRRCSALSALG